MSKKEFVGKLHTIVVRRGYGDGKISLQILDGCLISNELYIFPETANQLIEALKGAIEHREISKFEKEIQIR
jgi:hypothetical protein